jgi:hypothetical protein
MRERETDELSELPPEPQGVGKYAQTRHVDVDDATDKERVEIVERDPDLFEEVDRGEAVRVHRRECTGTCQVVAAEDARLVQRRTGHAAVEVRVTDRTVLRPDDVRRLGTADT